MTDTYRRRWIVALVSAVVLLTTACGIIPSSGGSGPDALLAHRERIQTAAAQEVPHLAEMLGQPVTYASSGVGVLNDPGWGPAFTRFSLGAGIEMPDSTVSPTADDLAQLLRDLGYPNAKPNDPNPYHSAIHASASATANGYRISLNYSEAATWTVDGVEYGRPNEYGIGYGVDDIRLSSDEYDAYQAEYEEADQNLGWAPPSTDS